MNKYVFNAFMLVYHFSLIIWMAAPELNNSVCDPELNCFNVYNVIKLINDAQLIDILSCHFAKQINVLW